MQMLQSWTFVNCAALAVGVASLLVYQMPAKLAAEADLRNYIPHALIAGLAWLVLAVLRFILTPRDHRN